MQTALVVALVGGAICLALVHFSKRRKVAGLLKGRSPLSDEDFARLFPTDQEGQAAVSIRRLLRPWVSFDIALVRPEDEFCGDLLLDALDGMDPEEFLASVEKEWRVKIPQSEALAPLSIAELAASIARLANERAI